MILLQESAIVCPDGRRDKLYELITGTGSFAYGIASTEASN